MEQRLINKDIVRAVAFDFGGTLDSPFRHWMDVYLDAYNGVLGLGIEREAFRESYVFAEREMDRLRSVESTTTLSEVQNMKTAMQCSDMIARGVLGSEYTTDGKHIATTVASIVTNRSAECTRHAADTLAKLSGRYTLLLVSNYYGNVRKVVTDLGIAGYFSSITDSTIEGVRKPNPALWRIAIERAGFSPNETVIVGDSFKNDVQPGLSLGCQAIHCVPQDKPLTDGVICVRDISKLCDVLL